jgi:prepilin-type processing-associated H-X9-DG protein
VCSSDLPAAEALRTGASGDISTFESYLFRWWIPYFGHPDANSFGGVAAAQQMHPQMKFAPMNGKTAILPFKISQVARASEQVFMSDTDLAQSVFDGAFASAASTVTIVNMAPAPAHGGKPETMSGGNPATREKARTNPPRNFLFFDGHVQTIRKSLSDFDREGWDNTTGITPGNPGILRF